MPDTKKSRSVGGSNHYRLIVPAVGILLAPMVAYMVSPNLALAVAALALALMAWILLRSASGEDSRVSSRLHKVGMAHLVLALLTLLLLFVRML